MMKFENLLFDAGENLNFIEKERRFIQSYLTVVFLSQTIEKLMIYFLLSNSRILKSLYLVESLYELLQLDSRKTCLIITKNGT